MKKSLLLALFSSTALNLFSQNIQSVFTSDEIVWFGLDFSKTTFVGQFEDRQSMQALRQANPYNSNPQERTYETAEDLKERWVKEWNSLVASEPKHFIIKEAFRKESVYYDLSSVTKINETINTQTCMSFNPGTIERTNVDLMAKNYSSSTRKEGLGMVVIVENLNQGLEIADMYITLFDIETQQILLCEKMQGKAGGSGLRNYWMGSLKKVLKQIYAEDYEAWKKNYKKKGK